MVVGQTSTVSGRIVGKSAGDKTTLAAAVTRPGLTANPRIVGPVIASRRCDSRPANRRGPSSNGSRLAGDAAACAPGAAPGARGPARRDRAATDRPRGPRCLPPAPRSASRTRRPTRRTPAATSRRPSSSDSHRKRRPASAHIEQRLLPVEAKRWAARSIRRNSSRRKAPNEPAVSAASRSRSRASSA
jgi:hypothetical protein